MIVALLGSLLLLAAPQLLGAVPDLAPRPQLLAALWCAALLFPRRTPLSFGVAAALGLPTFVAALRLDPTGCSLTSGAVLLGALLLAPRAAGPRAGACWLFGVALPALLPRVLDWGGGGPALLDGLAALGPLDAALHGVGPSPGGWPWLLGLFLLAGRPDSPEDPSEGPKEGTT